MRKPVLISFFVAGLISTLSFGQGRWEGYGSVPILPGTPYSSIYLGLKENNEKVVLELIREFTRTNGIRECPEFPGGYTGPPLAAYVGDKTAIFIRTYSTGFVATKQARGLNFGTSFDWYHWPTNGSMQTNGGRAVQMPYTAIIGVSPFGTNYSPERFKLISEGLTSSLHRGFTNRNIYMFLSDTNRP